MKKELPEMVLYHDKHKPIGKVISVTVDVDNTLLVKYRPYKKKPKKPKY